MYGKPTKLVKPAVFHWMPRIGSQADHIPGFMTDVITACANRITIPLIAGASQRDFRFAFERSVHLRIGHLITPGQSGYIAWPRFHNGLPSCAWGQDPQNVHSRAIVSWSLMQRQFPTGIFVC